jgi:hypothetical protein
MKIVLAASILTALTQQVSAGPLATCAAQKNCIQWTETKVTDGPSCSSHDADAACLIKVCLKMDVASSSCKGSTSESISHTCDGANTVGCPATEEVIDGGSYKDNDCSSGVSPGPFPGYCGGISGVYESCQFGTPGQSLYFIIKDGATESAGDQYSSVGSGCDPIIQCGPTEFFNCGGGANKVLERLWTYTISEEACASTCDDTPPPCEDCEPTCDACTRNDCGEVAPSCGTQKCCGGTCESNIFEGNDCPDDFPDELIPADADDCLIGPQCTADGQCKLAYKAADATCAQFDTTGLDAACYSGGKCVSVSETTGETKCMVSGWISRSKLLTKPFSSLLSCSFNFIMTS